MDREQTQVWEEIILRLFRGYVCTAGRQKLCQHKGTKSAVSTHGREQNAVLHPQPHRKGETVRDPLPTC